MLSRRAHRRLTPVALGVVVAWILIASAAPLTAAEPELGVHGLPHARTPLDASIEWIDPAIALGIDEADLMPVPEFDFTTLRASDIFATGVDTIPTKDEDLGGHEQRHLRVLQVLDTIGRDIEEATFTMNQLRPDIDRLNTRIATEEFHEARLADEITVYLHSITEFALRTFIGEDDAATNELQPDSTAAESRVMTDQVRDSHFIEIANREAELARRQVRRARLKEERRTTRRRLAELRELRLELLTEQQAMTALAERTAASYTLAFHGRLTSHAKGTNIPLVTLNAYVIGSRVLAEEQPRCGITWWMLAGIGAIESNHGQFGDTTVDINGYPVDPITGPALDGRILEGAEFVTDEAAAPAATDQTTSTPIVVTEVVGEAAVAAPPTEEGADVVVPVIKRLALIKDTDDGKYDGDRTYDRAVGPMQFIPQTWRQYGEDANFDGDVDPQNLYDAAVASARYLCRAAGNMTTEDGQRRAYFAYNHDDEYTQNVLDRSRVYQRILRVPTESDADTRPIGIATPSETGESTLDQPAVTGVDDLPDW